jgi:hypothetical protein
MYIFLIAVHSILRWLVLITLVYTIIQAFNGWFTGRKFNSRDNLLRVGSASIVHLQLIIGALLYFTSSSISQFLHNFKVEVHNSQARFLGMEHGLLMLIAIIVITIGSVKAKRKLNDKEKFRTMAIWFSIGLLIILVSIPWPFSPMASRPFFRAF